jgi:hypothetical protein
MVEPAATTNKNRQPAVTRYSAAPDLAPLRGNVSNAGNSNTRNSSRVDHRHAFPRAYSKVGAACLSLPLSRISIRASAARRNSYIPPIARERCSGWPLNVTCRPFSRFV